MHKRLLPVITEADKQLPYFVVDACCNWQQEHVIRPAGYLHQWILCLEGEGELLTGGKTYRIKKGMAMLLLKGVPHEYYALTPTWTVNWVVFDGHQVDAFLKGIAGITASGAYYVSRPELFITKVHSFWETYPDQSASTLKSLQWSSLVYSLLTDIVLYTSVQPNNSASTLHSRLKPLLDYIELHYNKPLTLEEMAEVAGITPQHLCTVFKKTANLRIFQYIHSVRIKKSKELLLQHPAMQVREIARMAGFEDANYFCSVFKKHEQMTPNQFRKLHQ